MKRPLTIGLQGDRQLPQQPQALAKIGDPYGGPIRSPQSTYDCIKICNFQPRYGLQNRAFCEPSLPEASKDRSVQRLLGEVYGLGAKSFEDSLAVITVDNDAQPIPVSDV